MTFTLFPQTSCSLFWGNFAEGPLLFYSPSFFLSSRLDIVLAEVVSFASGAAVPTPRHVKDRSRRLAGREGGSE